MAKSVIRLPRLNAKAAIAAALILFLPLVVLVASSPKLQDTRSSAKVTEGDGGGRPQATLSPIPGPTKLLAKYSCSSRTQAIIDFSWNKVPDAKTYDVGYARVGTGSWVDFSGGKIESDGKIHIKKSVGVGLGTLKLKWGANAVFSDDYSSVSRWTDGPIITLDCR